MKNYNKILEAVNRGIKFALDDYEDQEDIQGQSNSKVNHQDGTKEYLDLMNNVVDLGLPSGTLWCKYNLGCDYELLNNHPEQSNSEDWRGDYYAWGEIEANKPEYNWDNYKFGRIYQLTKYAFNVKTKYDKSNIDNLDYLLPEDDAAYQNMHLHNFKFYMPTMQQFEELKKYTTVKYKRKYNNINQLYGALLISKINGNTLFLPASGHTSFGSKPALADGHIEYWISGPISTWDGDNNELEILTIYKGYWQYIAESRLCGLPIRPVIKL